jgi:hypothetical protein
MNCGDHIINAQLVVQKYNDTTGYFGIRWLFLAKHYISFQESEKVFLPGFLQ